MSNLKFKIMKLKKFLSMSLVILCFNCGDDDMSNANPLTDTYSLDLVTANPDFSERYGHTSVSYNDRLWMTGGGPAFVSDTYSTSDGINWEEMDDEGPFFGINSHSSVVFDDKMWVVGGSFFFSGDPGSHDSSWCSSDGWNWNTVTSSASFNRRYGHTSVVFNNKIWVIGGIESLINYNNDVFSSNDGNLWNQETTGSLFSPRSGHSSIVFDNKIWVIGGYGGSSSNYNDVWYSEDGRNWVQASPNADFSPRAGHASVVFNNKMWVIGGQSTSGPANNEYYNDIWYSEDGISWTKSDITGPFFSSRSGHTATVYNDEIWIVAGYNDSLGNLKDVWTVQKTN